MGHAFSTVERVAVAPLDALEKQRNVPQHCRHPLMMQNLKQSPMMPQMMQMMIPMTAQHEVGAQILSIIQSADPRLFQYIYIYIIINIYI